MRRTGLSLILVALLLCPMPAWAQVFARPSSDITVGVWTTTPLWEKLDEVTADDTTTEITAPSIGSGDQFFEVKLSAVTDPGVHTGHIVRLRLRKSAAAGKTVFGGIQLLQGATIIAQLSSTAMDENYTTRVLTLTEAEAANITDYSDLRIVGLFTWASGGAGRDAFCTWAELEVPGEPPPASTVERRIIITENKPRRVITSIEPREYEDCKEGLCR